MPTPPPDLSFLPAYLASLRRLGRRAAIIEHGLYRTTSYSYGEILGKAAAFAAELPGRGVAAGDRVMLWGPSGAAWAIAFYGCILAGAVVVPLDAAFSAEFARTVGAQTEAKLVCAAGAVDLDIPALGFHTLEQLPVAELRAGIAPAESTLLEIVYTSGATAEPKGVMITHGNLLANLRPIAGEIAKYHGKARLFLPLRFLHLIPLSHLFGQVMGLLIPPLIESTVVYAEAAAPAAWARIIREQRVSVLVGVPQQMALMSQWAGSHVDAEAGAAVDAVAQARGHGVAWRWWRWRALHRALGWRMWALISGGAALAPEVEARWRALGFAVIQGYGLTETAPAITITHPFKMRQGAVGRKLSGVEMKIAGDGEILVKGGNVSPGYYQNAAATAAAFDGGWLHTGDLGRLDAEGNLTILGRKKEVIVTADGLNVYPEDVERALEADPRVAEAAAVEADTGHGPQVEAVVVLRGEADAAELAAVVAAANVRLEPHQRIRGAALWPGRELPRTASTGKLKRSALAAWVRQGQPAEAAATRGAANWRDFVAARWGIAAQRLRPEARLEQDLGLSSLDRVELFTWVEAHTVAQLDGDALGQTGTVAELDALTRAAAPHAAGAAAPAAPAHAAPARYGTARTYAPWPLAPGARVLRAGLLAGLALPALRTVVRRLEVEGAEPLQRLPRPVLFVANHQSMLDVPVILRALPAELRPWLAPAMGRDLLASYLKADAPGWRRGGAWLRFQAIRLVFNSYLLSEHGAVRAALRYSGELADRGYCPLIFPEGARTRTGRLQPFRPGVGVMTAALEIPVVPVVIHGLDAILPVGAKRARPGVARVRFGAVREYAGQTPQQISADLERYFRTEF